jgi:hypothetical protein
VSNEAVLVSADSASEVSLGGCPHQPAACSRPLAFVDTDYSSVLVRHHVGTREGCLTMPKISSVEEGGGAGLGDR